MFVSRSQYIIRPGLLQKNGWIKINADASFEVINGTCAIACICTDHNGMVLWARNDADLKCQDVPEGEAKACLLGLKSIHDANNVSIIQESDNSLVVDAIKQRKLFEDIKDIQDRCLRFEVVEIGRESNKAAHLLGDVARFSGQGYYCMGHVPPAVAEIVMSEAVKTVTPDI
jgi:ribonuclease HI